MGQTRSLVSKLDGTCVSSCSPLVVSINRFENFNYLSYPQGNQRKDISFSLDENFKGEVIFLLIISSVVGAAG